eukprot:10290975-Heterocapsa_arctica.AAC.1
MPPLQSELGQWAQRIVAAKEWMKKQLSSEVILDDSSTHELDIVDDLKPVVSFRMPPLQSEPGLRAQRIVSDELKVDQEFMEVVKTFRHAPDHRSEKLNGNRDVMTQAAKLHGSALQELKGDREFMLMAAKLGPALLHAHALQYAYLE